MTCSNPIHNFRDAALSYADLGYAVFPCITQEKKPLTQHGYLDASNDPEQIETWWKHHPTANVAIATKGLLVLDIDQESVWLNGQPERAMKLAIAPLSLTPNLGSHYFFRQPPGRSWRNTVGKIAPYVDTRADGGYVVVPPSLLSNKKRYRWAEGMVLNMSPDKLPIPPDWLIEILDSFAPSNSTTSNDSIFTSTESNRIPDGQRNATLTRLAGNMRRVGMSFQEMEAALLQANADRCDPPLPQSEVQHIARSVARYEPDQVSVAMVEDHWSQMVNQSDSDNDSDIHDPGPIPPSLLHVPGFINEVMDYTLETAPYPQKALAFCGALSLQALLAGRKVRDEADNRTGLYLLGLANTGVGKDHPRKVNQRILMEIGLPECIGDSFASGEGIEDRMLLTPAMLFQTDEIDGLMTKINQGSEGRHESIMNVLLKMYTSANAYYPMRVKANREADVIDQPCLCIFGTAIPKHYYEALSLKMLSNGFFARMLVVEADKRGKGQDAHIQEIPESILTVARWWHQFEPGKHGNLRTWHPKPQIIPSTTAAKKVKVEFREYAEHCYDVAQRQDHQAGMAFWARATEKVYRLALIYACSESHQSPLIDEPVVRWAWEFVDHQTQRMLFMASGHISENEHDARCKALLTTLRAWKVTHGDAPMPYWRINRKHP